MPNGKPYVCYGSQVAVGRPRMDFIAWTAGNGHERTLVGVVSDPGCAFPIGEA